VYTLFSAAYTAYLEATVYHHAASAVNVESTITISMVEQPFNTEFSQLQQKLQLLWHWNTWDFP